MASSHLPKKRHKKIIEEQPPKKLNILEENSSDDDISLTQLAAKFKTTSQPITPVKIERGTFIAVDILCTKIFLCVTAICYFYRAREFC